MLRKHSNRLPFIRAIDFFPDPYTLIARAGREVLARGTKRQTLDFGIVAFEDDAEFPILALFSLLLSFFTVTESPLASGRLIASPYPRSAVEGPGYYAELAGGEVRFPGCCADGARVAAFEDGVRCAGAEGGYVGGFAEGGAEEGE
ncbi:hypothetical protein V495_07944, partial [Pseudogymnoascus sp. VKM F-4514 (FW-929)]